jgi:membrane protein DedA with SNARE-associated domain
MTRLGLIAALVLSLSAVATAVLVDLPDVSATLTAATGRLGGWTYALVAVSVFLETTAVLGLLVPGETALAIAGAAAAHGNVELVPLLGIVWIAGILGDATGFALGRRYGSALLAPTARRIGIDAPHLARMTALLQCRSGVALVAGRFVGLLRSLTPFLAGSVGVPRRRLLTFSIIGVGVWGGVLTLAGYAASDALESHLDTAGNLVLAAAGAALLACALRRYHPSSQPRLENPC